MRTRDKMAFSRAARQFNCWILVRRTNPQSMRFIGVSGYAPKPIDCKAKTANNPKHKLAGLVVDPNLVPEAFLAGRLDDAKRCWSAFSGGLKIPSPSREYSVIADKKSDRYGCVTLNDKYLHGDYDLKDIILADQMHRNLASVEQLHGQPHMRGPLVLKVQHFVNSRIGSDMLQHGGEAQYADHSDEPIDAYGPGGEYKLFLNELAIRSWYNEINRPTLNPFAPSRSSSSSAPPGGRPWTPKVEKGEALPRAAPRVLYSS